MVGIDDIHAGQLVAVALKDSVNGEAPYLPAEPGVLAEQVARGAAERSRIGAALISKIQGEIEETSILRRCKPPAGFAARCGQIQKNLLRAARIFLDDRPEGGEAC